MGHGNNARPKRLIKRNAGGEGAKFVEQFDRAAILKLTRLRVTRMNVQGVIQMLGSF